MNFTADALWEDGMCGIKNQTLFFRIKLSGLHSAEIRIAAENVYQLYAFDSFISFGPVRAAHGYTRIDCIDLKHALRDGYLVVTVVVVGNRVNSYCTSDDHPFFAAEILSNGIVIATTKNFEAYAATDRIIKTQRYSFQRHFSESYFMQKDRRNFYLGLESQFPSVKTVVMGGNKSLKRQIDYPSYEEIQAENKIDQGRAAKNTCLAKVKDRALNEVGNFIKGYPYEELEDRLTDEASCLTYSPESVVEGLSDQYVLYDFGRNITGFIGLNVNVSSAVEIYILWDEILTDEESHTLDFFRMQTCNVIKWKLMPGSYRLLSFEPYTMRYARLVVLDGKANVEKLYLKLLENPNASSLEFQCVNEQLTAIMEAARNTFAQNAVDILTDCPSRERAGWLCDSYFTAQAEKLLTGKNEIERNFLENYIMAPQDKDLPEGMIAMCYPSDNLDQVYIGNWAMWFVIELESYFKRTGDRVIIERSREKVMNLLSFFKKYENEYGLLEKLESWVFIEWSKSNDFVQDVSFPSNMLYCGMLDAASKIYDRPDLFEKAQNLRRTIAEWSYNGEFFTDNAVRENNVLKTTGNTTETCQYYAFYFGIASPDTYPVLFDRILNQFGSGRDANLVFPEVHKSNAFIGNFLRLDYLIRIGMGLKAVGECLDYFGFMAERTGTLWEHDSTYASCNHGFESYVANLIVSGLTGF